MKWIARLHATVAILAGFLALISISHGNIAFFFINLVLMAINFFSAHKAYERVRNENRSRL